MDIRKFSICIPVIIISIIACTSVQKEMQTDPNIVLIFMDDMGYGDPEVYGGTGYKTPNMNKLAKEGMKFTNFYSAQAICTASRAGLLTGCYPNRIGMAGALFPDTKNGLNPNEVTIAEMLKGNGYATAIYGKWHLGHLEEFMPLQNGFDEYTGIPYSNDMWPVDFEGNLRTDPNHPRVLRCPPLPLIEGNNKIKEITSLGGQAELTTIYTEKAVDFINRKKDEPFFLYVPHTMPHVPIAVSDKFLGKSEQGLYGDLMMELDWSVGEIMKALEKNGLTENTLVILTSDNGPWLTFGNHAGSSGGLKEGKLSSWEGGQRVPCIMKWPTTIPEGTVCNKLSSTIDLFPTFASITDSKLPDHKIDGVNLISLLKNEPNANPRENFYYYFKQNDLEAVRKGTWKLVLPHPFRTTHGNEPGRDGFPGNTTTDSVSSVQLFDLRRDPGEQYDVSKFNPDIVADLQLVVEEARQDLGDNLAGLKGKNVRPIGLAKD